MFDSKVRGLGFGLFGFGIWAARRLNDDRPQAHARILSLVAVVVEDQGRGRRKRVEGACARNPKPKH